MPLRYTAAPCPARSYDLNLLFRKERARHALQTFVLTYTYIEIVFYRIIITPPTLSLPEVKRVVHLCRRVNSVFLHIPQLLITATKDTHHDMQKFFCLMCCLRSKVGNHQDGLSATCWLLIEKGGLRSIL